MTKKEEILSTPELTPEQRTMVDRLPETDLRKIDQALLSNASSQWSHTSRVVLTTMIELDNGMGLPKGFFHERIVHLIGAGRLESKDDTQPPTEIRITTKE